MDKTLEESDISDDDNRLKKKTTIATASEVEVVPDLDQDQTSICLMHSETDNDENFYELPTQLSTLSSRLMDLMNLSENSTEGEQDGTMEPVHLSENSSEMKQGKDTKDMHSAQDRLQLSTFGLTHSKSFHVRNEHKIWDPGKEF